jgi:hypothetical protein
MSVRRISLYIGRLKSVEFSLTFISSCLSSVLVSRLTLVCCAGFPLLDRPISLNLVLVARLGIAVLLCDVADLF